MSPQPPPRYGELGRWTRSLVGATCGCHVYSEPLPLTDGPEFGIGHCSLHRAAPDLLAALEQTLLAVPWDCEYPARCGTEDIECSQCAAQRIARAAIRKAKGE